MKEMQVQAPVGTIIGPIMSVDPGTGYIVEYCKIIVDTNGTQMDPHGDSLRKDEYPDLYAVIGDCYTRGFRPRWWKMHKRRRWDHEVASDPYFRLPDLRLNVVTRGDT